MSYPATFAGPQTRADWAAQNPYLPQFEFGQESDAPYGVKVGPGYWNDLSYIANSGIKIYRATLTQSGGDAPVATVLENTLGGTLVWTRTGAGVYTATLVDAFPDQTKIFCSVTYGINNSDPTLDGIIVSANYGNADSVLLYGVNVEGASADMNVGNAAVQILVYP